VIKTVETENQGLKRAFMLTIPAEDIDKRVEQEVKRIAPQVQMPGFRPGKVPANLIRKMHGDSLKGQALEGAVQDGVQQLLAEQKLRPAMQPEVELKEGYEHGKDAEIAVRLEALPDVPSPNIEGLKLERLTVEADDAAIEQQLQQLASANKSWTDAKKGKAAETGDQVVLDFAGSVDGKAFDGGTGEDMQVELGSGRLIPGFEEQLVGAKVGDQRTLDVTFPDDYPVENLKSKPAKFEVTVKAVKVAGESKIDDELAKMLGLEDVDQLRKILRDQQSQELNGLTRTHMKRRLLDELAARHDFQVPESMVEAEYNNIMNQLRHEASHEENPQAALDEIESEKDDYRTIAERRVRLGLLLSEIGAANGVEVSSQEMNRLIGQAAAQYQGEDRNRFIQYIQQEPMAAAQLRAPLYEDKVVDFLFSKAEITDRPSTRAELEADLESEEGHVHGPDCGHDHGEGKAKKPAAKAKKDTSGGKTKSAPAEAVKTAAEAKKVAPKPEKPAKGAVEAEGTAPKPAKPVKDGAGAKAPAAKKAPAKKAK
jgi:trigger factor